jgi:hypothetical protein
LPPDGRRPHHPGVTTDDCELLADAGPIPTWTLETLTGDLYHALAPLAARRGVRFVLYHEGTAWLDAAQARRAKGVLVHALASKIADAPAGAPFRVDIAGVPALACGRWLQVHATTDAGTVLWLSLPLEG